MAGRVALVPLDDRPANRRFPAEVAALAGWEVELPPRHLLGWFRVPGRAEPIWEWVGQVAGGAQALVLSADMTCYGGLVASRTPLVSTELALARLERLRQVRRAHPRLPILAFGVIMRLGITVDSERAQEQMQRVWRYSRLAPQDRKWASEPPDQDVWQAYLAARARNHEVNQALVRLAAEGAVDFLALAQEDCAPQGLHRAEQQELAELAEALGVAERVLILPGADEVGLCLVARAVLHQEGWAPRVWVRYAAPEGAERVARYEDRPLRDTLAGHLTLLGACSAGAQTEADFTLWVHTPLEEQEDLAQAARPLPDSHATKAARAICTEMGRGPVAVADVAYANGGDLPFVEALADRGALPSLAAYAGWNTAGNTIGTALAHGALGALAAGTPSPAQEQARLQFLLARCLDDGGYQAWVRARANRWAREQLGASPLDLGPAWRKTESFVRRELGEWAQQFRARFLVGEPALADILVGQARGVRLPWRRTFECELGQALMRHR